MRDGPIIFLIGDECMLCVNDFECNNDSLLNSIINLNAKMCNLLVFNTVVVKCKICTMPSNESSQYML